MAVPWINILAPEMGGIGPVELADLEKLGQIQGANGNGVPFYAGRFYPRDSKAILENIFNFGLISETPPWLTWQEIQPTQIWMVPVFEDERVVSTATSIERIDIWPRDDDSEIGPWEPTEYDLEQQYRGWGEGGIFLPSSGSIDPSVEVVQNVVPPVLFAGYVGISQIQGHFSEYAFYDQELFMVNGVEYEQPVYRAYEEGYKEFIRLRQDGAWYNTNFEYSYQGDLEFPEENGYPIGGFKNTRDPYNDYLTMAITDREVAGKWGNDTINTYTRWVGTNPGSPLMGQLLRLKPTRLDTVVFTIKTSVVTINVPDPVPGETQLAMADLARSGLESFGSNLTNNVWYFYLPVRYNWEKFNERSQFLLNRAGINRRDDPYYYAE